jgi:hypothetical protein
MLSFFRQAHRWADHLTISDPARPDPRQRRRMNPKLLLAVLGFLRRFFVLALLNDGEGAPKRR